MKHLLALFLTLILSLSVCWSQNSKSELLKQLQNAKEDKNQVDILVKLAEISMTEKNLDGSTQYANEAVTLGKNLSYTKGVANAHLILGEVQKEKQQFATSLDFLLQASKEFKELGDTKKSSVVFEQIGLLYKDFDVNEKALENFSKALSFFENLNDTKGIIEVSELMANSYILIGDNGNALKYYEKVLALHKKEGNKNAVIATYRNISDIHKNSNKHQKGLEVNLKILDALKETKDSSGMAISYNNIGFLYRRLGENNKSLEYFLLSLELNRRLNGDSPTIKEDEIVATTLRNIGVLYQNLGDNEKSLKYFKEAFDLEESHQKNTKAALTANYIAASYFVRSDMGKATTYSKRAVDFAQKDNAVEVLATSYKRLSQINERQKKFKEALEYFQQHSAMKDSLLIAERRKQQEILRKQSEVEKKGKELKLLLIDKEVKDLALKKLQLESEKKQQQYALLLRDKELQEFTLKNAELKKNQAVKELQLAQQKLTAEKDQQEIAALQKNKEIQDLALKQKELERKQLEEARKLAESATLLQKRENELQNLKLNEEKTKNTYFFFIILGAAFTLILIIIGYINQRKARRTLAMQNVQIIQQNEEIESKNVALEDQKKEIITKNTELEQQQEEILAQNEVLEQTYNNIKTLSETGQQITASLHIESIIKTVYESVVELMPAESFGIGTLNIINNSIDFRGYIEHGEVLPDHNDSLDKKALSTLCLKEGIEIFINDVETEYGKFIEGETQLIIDDENQGSVPLSLIYLPLKIENKEMGVITVQSFDKNAYNGNHLAMLRTLANYIAVALDNAKAYEIIQEEKQKITDSIRYAERIQQAILVSELNMKNVFSDSFVIFKPKDIVSGDFYWYSKVEDKVFIATVDCTGHGVPGAFMSMIGNTLLNEIINEKKIFDPKEILIRLDSGVRIALQQDSTNNTDGMDLSLCRLENGDGKNYKLTYSGAKGVTYYHTNGKLGELKGDRFSIGGYRKSNSKKVSFTNQEVQLSKGDSLFLTTDGFIDIANDQRKRFGTPKFKKMITQNIDNPFEIQKEVFNSALEKFQGEAAQRDDITVVGVKL